MKNPVAAGSNGCNDVLLQTMLTLVLETSTPRGSLALFDGESLLETRDFQAVRGHSSTIYPPLKELLASLGRRRLQRLAVGTGPGSYTGVRVAIAIADALALSYEAELTGRSSLVAGQAAKGRERYWMVGDARRQSWYRAEVREGHLAGPIVTENRSTWEKAVQRALDEGMAVYTFDSESPIPGVTLDVPTAQRLGELIHGTLCPPGPLEPIYLAPPYITQPRNRERTAKL